MATQNTIAEASPDIDLLFAKIKKLSNVAWDRDCEGPIVHQWLDQFTGASGLSTGEEQYHMLFLLTNFLYFGTREIRELLRALYRDLFKYAIVARLRKRHHDTTDRSFIDSRFNSELQRTRFLPIGNPSESSSHLLYYFRQENRLPKHCFINPHQAFASPDKRALNDPLINRYVFIDDFAGSGHQALQYAQDVASPIHTISPKTEVVYYVLISTTAALDRIRDVGIFSDVGCVFELSDDFRAFSPNSLSFVNAPCTVSKSKAKTIATCYGSRLLPAHPLGYSDGQLLLGFSHNVPDNTLPVFWFPENHLAWTAPFPRHPKFEA